MFRFPFTLFLAACIPLAAPASSASGAETTKCVLTFYTLKPRTVHKRQEVADAAVQPELPRHFHFANGKGWSNVVLQPGEFSAPLRYRGPADIRFFERVPQVEPASAREAVTVSISPAWKHALVILRTGREDGEGLPFKASCQEWKALEEASLRLVNLADSPLEIRIGGMEVHLAPDQNYDLNLRQIEDAYMPIQIHEARDGEQIVAYDRKLRIDRESRMLLLLQRERGDSGRLRVSTLSLDSDEP